MAAHSDNVISSVDKTADDQFVQYYAQHVFLLPEYDWGDLLSAAPRSLVALGNAFVAASSVAASKTVQLEASNGLQYTSLRACLQQCVDLGQEAFLETEAKMQRVDYMAKVIAQDDGSVDKIVRLCQNKEIAQRELPRQIKRLREMSSECVADTTAVEQKFDAWGQMVAALQRACLSTDDSSRLSRTVLSETITMKQEELEFQRKEIDAAKERMAVGREALQNHANDLIAMQKAIPTGWRAAAINASSSLASIPEKTASALAAMTVTVKAGIPSFGGSAEVTRHGREGRTSEERRERRAKRRARKSLQMARQNYLDSQKAYLESQKLYQELIDRDQIQKQKFNDIQLDLQKLAEENISIEEVMRILNTCMKHLSEFKGHVTELRQLFIGIREYVNVIDRTHLAGFTDGADQLSEAGTPDQVRAYYLEEIKRDALKVKGSYLMVGSITKSYVAVSQKHIMPGVNLVNRLILSTEDGSSLDTIKAKVKEINTYARGAQSEISNLAQKRRQRLQGQLKEFESLISSAERVIELAESPSDDRHEHDNAGLNGPGDDEWDSFSDDNDK